MALSRVDVGANLDAEDGGDDRGLLELESLYEKKLIALNAKISALEQERDDLRCRNQELTVQAKSEMIEVLQEAKMSIREQAEEFDEEKNNWQS
jgi:hypothetical protein